MTLVVVFIQLENNVKDEFSDHIQHSLGGRSCQKEAPLTASMVPLTPSPSPMTRYVISETGQHIGHDPYYKFQNIHHYQYP